MTRRKLVETARVSAYLLLMCLIMLAVAVALLGCDANREPLSPQQSMVLMQMMHQQAPPPPMYPRRQMQCHAWGGEYLSCSE